MNRQLPPEPFDSDFDKMKPEYRSDDELSAAADSSRNLDQLWSSARTQEQRMIILLPWFVVLGVLFCVLVYLLLSMVS